MRRFSLGFVIAAVLAMPATGREFRVEGNACLDASPSYFCWGGMLPSSAEVALPTDGATSPFTPGANQSPSVNPAVFTHNGFTFTAFDYPGFLAANAAFLLANGYPPDTFSAPTVTVTLGFGRVSSSPGQPFDSGDAPLLRINWNFDSDLLDLFRNDGDGIADIFDADNFNGVQLIFYGDGTNAFPTVASGAGFELNGLNSYDYSFSTLNREPLWNGRNEPCGTFNNAGVCIGSVPEPSSVALLGLGFLALVVGWRKGTPARARLA